jgi:small subunit ribosomal protein S12
MFCFYYYMATINQICKRKIRKLRYKKKPDAPLLYGCPQKRGVCQRVFACAPKKPNSASRKVVSVLLAFSKRVAIHCHIPGVRHSLQQYSTVLVRGGRAKDLPGVKYRLVRGKFDLKRVFDRYKARSKYGIKKP